MNLLINNTDCAVHSRAIAKAIANTTRLNGVEAIVAAEFIQQLHYWTEKGAGILKDGVQWIYNTYEQWIEIQFPSLSKYHLRKIKNALLSAGLISVKQLRNKQWNQTYHYALKYDALLELEELKPLKNSKVKSVDHQRSIGCSIEDRSCEASYTKNTSIENLQKEKNIKQKNFSESSDKKSSSTSSMNIEATDTLNCSSLDCPEEINVPRVDEKINSKPVLKKDMAKHTPQGDRYFGQRNQQSEVRGRAKMDSAVGMSGFTDVEELRECQRQLTSYFAKQIEPVKAAEKASWIIKAERQGERSPYVQDYLDGKAIGSWCKEEWEIEPGIIAPVLIAYLRCKLRKNGDTHAHSLSRVSWELKNRNLTANHWAECKRLIDIEKPRLEKALELGQDLVTQNVPEWIIEIYRPEVSVERAAETAEVLGAIATQYNDRVEQVQRQLEPAQYADHLLEDNKGSALSKLKKALGLPTAEKACDEDEASRLIEEEERKKAADAVMDRIVTDGKRLELSELLPNVPEAKLLRLQSEIEEISDLLSDPITRETGLRRAGNLGLPILYSNDGEAIAIDTLSIKDDDEINFNNISRDGSVTSSEGKYQAHQIYQPEQVEKGSKSAWEEAIARSKFLSKRVRTKEIDK